MAASAGSADQGFFQDPPRLGNQFDEDTQLLAALTRLHSQSRLPPETRRDLSSFGGRVVRELQPMARVLDTPKAHPTL